MHRATQPALMNAHPVREGDGLTLVDTGWKGHASRLTPTAERHVRSLQPARLAPGHGKVVEGPGAAMKTAIARGV